jgi:flagellar hook assembly protein FlgD
LTAGVVVQVNQVSQRQRRDKRDRWDGRDSSDSIAGDMAVNPQLRAVKQSETAFAIVEDVDFVDSYVKHNYFLFLRFDFPYFITFFV